MRTSTHGAIAALATLAVVALGCDRPEAAVNSPLPRPLFWEGCVAGKKYTGGGRVDPANAGKVTFGFNVHAGDCSGTDLKGQMQVVYHDWGPTLVHVETIDHFSSFHDEVKGDCGEFSGTARVKHVHVEDWHMHSYFTEVCDKAEPGRGADRFSFFIDGDRSLHQDVVEEVLTGGNIQAHKN